MRNLSFLLVAILAACAPKLAWVGEDSAGFHSNAIECRSVAHNSFDTPYGILEEEIWMDDVQAAFNDCMKNKGWIAK